jgi:hypothetical protein
MKRLSFVLMLAALSSAFAFASPASSHAKLTPVKTTHYHRDKRVTRHRAHKAAKHHAPKHHRRSV